MKLDNSNLYIKEKDKLFVICIEMPDSRNYLHSDLMFSLGDAMRYKKGLLDVVIGDWNTTIEKDETYFRVYPKLTCIDPLDGIEVIMDFHSRKLNLNDAEFEYFQVIQ